LEKLSYFEENAENRKELKQKIEEIKLKRMMHAKRQNSVSDFEAIKFENLPQF
jgi:hypothetical protein